MDQPDLKVHDISVSHQQAIDSHGNISVQKRLTFFVGSHGPFFKTYSEAEGTADRMKSDIGAQVAELQSLNQLQG